MDANNKQTYLRFFHGFPSNVAVDLYLGDRKIASGLTFGGFTPYTAVDPGRYMLVMYPAGERNAPLIKNDVIVPSGEIYTRVSICRRTELRCDLAIWRQGWSRSMRC